MQSITDKRLGQRVALVAPVNCSSLEEGNGKFSGILIDKSSSGLGMYTYYTLDEGQEIEICGNALWSECKVASVKWTKKVTSDLFRIGLSLN